MKKQDGFTSMSPSEFAAWLRQQKVARKVKRIQWHHTWAPDYSGFNGSNHFARQKAMKDYHVSHNGWDDIAQHFTIFPDGMILTGRSLSSTPIGIRGANTGGVCIENFGNFDDGADVMREAQREALLTVTAALLRCFGLRPETGVTYHCWWSADGVYLGDFIRGKSCKTCPGTNFMGFGNSRAAFDSQAVPLLQRYMEGKKEEDEMQRYNKVSEVPEIYRKEVQELINVGVLSGDQKGDLNLTEDMIRTLIIAKRYADRKD